MGIPYSKQINAAFDEVTPLVAAGFEVLRTSRNISILLAIIQILNFLLLGLTVLLLMALLITVSPDLENERHEIVTPAVKWVVSWLQDRTWLRLAIGAIFFGSILGGIGGWYYTRDDAFAEYLADSEEDDAHAEDAAGGG